MQVKKVIMAILLILCGALCIGYPLAYWFLNPELSKMQVFLHVWPELLVGMAAGIAFGELSE